MLLGVSSILSRILGVIRDSLIAHEFGLGQSGGLFLLDAYYSAFRIPDFIYSVFMAGAFSLVFIPYFTKLKINEGTKEAKDFEGQLATGVLLVMSLTLLLVFLMVDTFIPLLNPGYSYEDMTLTIKLTKTMLLSPLFFTISSLFQANANLKDRFWGLALAPIIYNLGQIIVIAIFAREYGVMALTYGVILGAFLQMVIQLPFLGGYKFRCIEFTRKNLSRISLFMKALFLRTLSSSFLQITMLVSTILCSFLPIGSLSLFTYALNIQSFPFGVVGLSLSTAHFSKLSHAAQNGNSIEFKKLWIGLCKTSFLVGSIFTLILFLLQKPLIQLFLESGAFTPAMTEDLYSLSSVLLWGAIPQCVSTIINRGFYSLNDNATPLGLMAYGMTLNIFLSIIMAMHLGLGLFGLALANLISHIFYCCISFKFLFYKKL